MALTIEDSSKQEDLKVPKYGLDSNSDTLPVYQDFQQRRLISIEKTLHKKIHTRTCTYSGIITTRFLGFSMHLNYLEDFLGYILLSPLLEL